MNTRKRRHLLFMAFLLAATGCGGPLVKVTGKLTYKGEPVPSTIVTFHPDEEGQRASQGITDDQGHFALSHSKTETGALRGKHTVTLRYHLSADEEMGKASPKASKELKAVIKKYGDLKTSPLHYEVTHNGQVIEIDLE
jgi:hypothetical protein